MTLMSQQPAASRYAITDQLATSMDAILARELAALEIVLRILPTEDPDYPTITKLYQNTRIQYWHALGGDQ